MTRMLLLVLSLGASVTVAFTQPVRYVEIDGSKHPELIPDWATWESAFGALALAKRSESVAVPASLHMSDADQRLVFEAAKGQATRDSTCHERVERLRPLLGKVKDSEINARTRDIQLECRQATLDAGSKLMEALTPEGQVAMSAWLQTLKAGIKVHVPENELEHYRRPH